MNRGLLIFGLWCIAVVTGFAYASFAGYSPFADGARAERGAGGVVIGRPGGPRHK